MQHKPLASRQVIHAEKQNIESTCREWSLRHWHTSVCCTKKTRQKPPQMFKSPHVNSQTKFNICMPQVCTMSPQRRELRGTQTILKAASNTFWPWSSHGTSAPQLFPHQIHADSRWRSWGTMAGTGDTTTLLESKVKSTVGTPCFQKSNYRDYASASSASRLTVNSCVPPPRPSCA